MAPTMPPSEPQNLTTASRLPHRSSAYASRRPPAHKSVSLLHSTPSTSKLSPSRLHDKHRKTSSVTSQQPPQSIVANPPSSSPSSVRQPKQNSSGESSDAGRWFETSNNDVCQRNDFSPDNDPPFFLRNSSSSETPPEGTIPFPPTLSAVQRAGLGNLQTEGSSDDYRSVIDDLTIENKQLKKRLKRYEKMHDAHLQGDRLFEVRFHALPPQKKRELEETLRKFALSVDDPVSTEVSKSPMTGIGTGASQTYIPGTLKPRNTATSSGTSRVADSGYASMSASGQGNSSIPSGQDSAHSKSVSRPAFTRNNSEIHSYLHDIPIGLMPRGNTTAMTEKSRKKLVVRRLEQIFAGKGAVGGHQHPMQQQEVANSAAIADRKLSEAKGKQSQKEGNRIAKIMPSIDQDDEIESTGAIQHHGLPATVAQQDFADTASPDQRPTRPLDLDPHREQVPSDNIEYFRHLGFTPQDQGLSPEDDHGWLYLNLVINMAQLHTINVTVDFVKHAVEKYSSKLELSKDGRKIRWKGGQDITRNSSDTSSERREGVSPDSVLDGTGATGLKRTISSSDNSDPRKKAQKLARLQKEKENNKLLYTPIFHHKDESDDEDDCLNMEMSSISSPMPGRDSSAFASSGMRTSSSKRRREDGPIIFYNKAKFCTDLSGDANAAGLPNKNVTSYDPVTTRPVGEDLNSGSPLRDVFERRDITGVFRNVVDDVEMKDINSTPSSTSSEFHFSLKSLENNASTNKQFKAYDFEVSGLGGVQPQDHFAIHVVSRHIKHDEEASKKRGSHPPHKLDAVVADARRSNIAFTDEIVSTKTETLPVSTLPPASFLPLDSSSPDAEFSDDSDASDADSDVDMLDDLRPPTVSRQPLSNYRDDSSDEDDYTSEEDDDEDDDDDDDDGDVDFLAGARKVAPEAVRAQEREYDSNVAERLAEEIPAGSSAATAGGGSGFTSPASNTAAASELDRGASLSLTQTGNSLDVVPE
ncbi:hypothetical protein EJ05DRAFT_514569 [Pseudovirgaria hyperparasitica]|uniref:Frequency clock protein n=1 Tax=Pseudovirgaria hyperparasitica TaxID=470096 RepID=A0A6A6VTY1_9PEZI|nr:uncharacterized protein EJ05DRAFT_514569 [Pseudovirgaria hyperparasitica]KAF2753605.1 hypothetical protein EJ05DRAFT_514569 [Pseudovirgaria hyperparasitica]